MDMKDWLEGADAPPLSETKMAEYRLKNAISLLRQVEEKVLVSRQARDTTAATIAALTRPMRGESAERTALLRPRREQAASPLRGKLAVQEAALAPLEAELSSKRQRVAELTQALDELRC